MDVIKIRQEQRQNRIKTIQNSIEAVMLDDKTVEEEKLIAESQFRFSASRRTILEYLNQLEQLGLIVREDGKIWTPAAYQAEIILKKAADYAKQETQEVKT